MKQIGLLIISVLFSIMMVEAQTKKPQVDMAFDKTIDGITAHDYGSIVYGANGKVDFEYTNQGKTPLIITDVKSSCGCTVPTWTKEPVEPGKKGVVSIVYNTTLPGVFNKTVVVYSNASNSPVRLEVRGKVNSQPGDLKQGGADASKQNEIDRQLEVANGGAKQTGETAATMQSTDSVARRKALQRKAYEERVEKQKAGQATGVKTGTGVKKTTGTTTKPATGTTNTKPTTGTASKQAVGVVTEKK